MKLEEMNITRLVTDSRKVSPGDTFVAYPGEKLDGRLFIADAIRAGAASVIWEEEGFSWKEDWNIPNLAIRGLREQAGEIASRVYGNPSGKLWVVGVTGTNGKTSCSHWIASAMTKLGKKTAVVGTLGNGFPGKLSPTSNTTPDPVLLQELLAQYLKEGAHCVAMEVSSHALSQGRVAGVEFDVALFTNLTRDHLDYHGDMASYGAAKASLFMRPELKYAILNADDPFTAGLKKRESAAKKIPYGFVNTGDSMQVLGGELRMHGGLLSLDVESPWGNGVIESPVVGRFNASNLLGVLSVLLASGYDLESAVNALAEIAPVPGRMQQVGGGGAPLVVVDYAHTPDALENVLSTMREVAPKGRLICIFGCGGDRDAGKRPVMGRIASRLADHVVVTSDNPRSEDPRAIISEIIAGIEGDYCVMADREKAIRQTILASSMFDMILIAGKGHEEYQEISGKKFPFSDLEISRAAIDEWGMR